jgi:hypothetical protein
MNIRQIHDWMTQMVAWDANLYDTDSVLILGELDELLRDSEGKRGPLWFRLKADAIINKYS